MKKIIYPIIMILLILTACGKNESITGVTTHPVNGLIRSLSVVNNRLLLTTTEPSHIAIQYYNQMNNEEYYRGWSADSLSYTHDIALPVSGSTFMYTAYLKVEVNNTYQDTTFTFISNGTQNDFLKLHFIDVRQGDGILVQTPDGKNIQVDGGYGSHGDSDLDWQGFGQKIAYNYLQDNQVTHLDYIVETHPHGDHNGGLRDITNSGNYTNYTYISPSNTFGYTEGDFLQLNSPVSVRVMNIGYPPDYTDGSVNCQSIVLRVVYGQAEFLLTGDAEGAVETYMMSNPYPLSCDLLKIAHHGASSNGTSSMSFLNTVLNQYCKIGILSFGTNNPYQHPRELSRFTNFHVFGTQNSTGLPSSGDFHFNMNTIITYSDGDAIIVTSKKND